MVWKGRFMARPKEEIVPIKSHTLVVRLDDIQYSMVQQQMMPTKPQRIANIKPPNRIQRMFPTSRILKPCHLL